MRVNTFWGPMNCKRALPLLEGYLDGALSGRTASEVEAHLGRCGDCKRELRILDRVIQAVESMPRREPPSGMWLQVQRELSQASAPTAPLFPGMRRPRLDWGRWRNPLVGALALGTAVAAAAFWVQPAADLPVPPRPAESTVTPYVSQATEASFFDPLADRAALGTVVTVSSRHPSSNDLRTFRPAVQIEDVMGRSQ